jgi:hypothetical protein
MKDGEAALVKVVADEHRHAVLAHFIDQLARRGHRHALGDHDGDVVAFGDLSRFKQQIEALLF